MPDSQSPDIVALRSLCESVYQPTEERLNAVIAFDWSPYPRIARVLDELPRPHTRDALSRTALEVLSEAARDLADAFPAETERITPLEVFHLHVLQQAPWPAIEAQFEEEGRPVSRGTLIRRQREFLPFVLEWASRPTQEVGDISLDSSAHVSGRRRWWRGVPGVVFASASVLLAVFALGARVSMPERSGSSATQRARVISPAIEGRQIGLQPEDSTLPDPYPPYAIPNEGRRVIRAMVLEQEPGKVRVLFGYTRPGDLAARLRLVDPESGKTLWDVGFDPPPDKRITHCDVGDEVLDQTYEPAVLLHAGPEGDLGSYVVVSAKQHWSPTFVAFVHLETGTIDGYYAHPGMLLNGLVLDVSGDGRPEAILGGCDNTKNRAVVVALQPGSWTGAASTVKWNESGEEQALARVLLAPIRDAEEALKAPRLFVPAFEDRSHFDPGARILRVPVGSPARVDNPYRRVADKTGWIKFYHARLGENLRPLASAPITLWDSDVLSLDAFGIEPSRAGDWENDLIYVEGVSRVRAEPSSR